jgi:hypothetical protein
MSIKKVRGSPGTAGIEEHPSQGSRGIRSLPPASSLKSFHRQDIPPAKQAMVFWGGGLYWAKIRPNLLRKTTDSRWYCQVYWNS